MTYLIASFWLPALLSALIGAATGWWIWRNPAEAEQEWQDDYAPAAAPIIPPAPPEPEPDVEPEPLPEPELETAPEPIEEQAADTSPEAAPMEQPVSAAPPEPEPVSEPEPEPEGPASPFLDTPDGEPDNLTLIKGVGPKLGDMLQAIGVFHFTQIADWDADQIAEVDSHLGAFKGRISRDRWVDQARLLAARNVAAFEREFGKMNGPL